MKYQLLGTGFLQASTALVVGGIIVFSALFASCSGSSPEGERKLDPLLREKLGALESAGSSEKIGVVGRCALPIDDSIRKNLEETGASIGTAVKTTFTAAGTAPQIRKLAALSAVISLELAVERQSIPY